MDEGVVEFGQRGGIDECAKLRKPAWAHQQRGQAEHEAID